MFSKSRSRKAFDHCGVRAPVSQNESGNRYRMICPKYPNGFEVKEYQMERSDMRGTLALKLGCITCPYKDEKLEKGESTVEAIQRLASERSIEELNSLLSMETVKDPAEEPPRPPQQPGS